MAVAALAALVAVVAPGCNTVKGVGQDIQKGAEATERAITD